MGQCYTTYCTLKIRTHLVEMARAALSDYLVQHQNEGAKFQNEVTPDMTLSEALRAVFTNEVKETMTSSGTGIEIETSSIFEASYGWEGILYESFKILYPFLQDGSYLEVYPDNGYSHYFIQDGKLMTREQAYDPRPYLADAEDVINQAGYESPVYNIKTGDLIILKNNESYSRYMLDIAVVRLGAEKITKECGPDENSSDFWREFLKDYDPAATFTEEIACEMLKDIFTGEDVTEEWICINRNTIDFLPPVAA